MARVSNWDDAPYPVESAGGGGGEGDALDPVERGGGGGEGEALDPTLPGRCKMPFHTFRVFITLSQELLVFLITVTG